MRAPLAERTSASDDRRRRAENDLRASPGRLPRPPHKMPRMLLPMDVLPNPLVGAAALPPAGSRPVAQHQSERHWIATHVEERAEHQIPGSITGVMGRATLRQPGSPSWAVAESLGPVVANGRSRNVCVRQPSAFALNSSSPSPPMRSSSGSSWRRRSNRSPGRPPAGGARAVRRTVLYDDPSGRSVPLRGKARTEPGEVVRFVAGGSPGRMPGKRLAHRRRDGRMTAAVSGTTSECSARGRSPHAVRGSRDTERQPQRWRAELHLWGVAVLPFQLAAGSPCTATLDRMKVPALVDVVAPADALEATSRRPALQSRRGW